MKLVAIILVLATLATAAPPTTGTTTGSVTLEVTSIHHALPADVACTVTLPVPTTGAAVLDAAVASGCLKSWTSAEYEGFGRYVTCIDDRCESDVRFWAFYLDGKPAEGGIDNTNSKATVAADAEVEFVFADWFTPFALP